MCQSDALGPFFHSRGNLMLTGDVMLYSVFGLLGMASAIAAILGISAGDR